MESGTKWWWVVWGGQKKELGKWGASLPGPGGRREREKKEVTCGIHSSKQSQLREITVCKSVLRTVVTNNSVISTAASVVFDLDLNALKASFLSTQKC